jgi:hypothetical protein
MAGAHRHGTPIPQLLAQLAADREAGILPGKISDRIRREPGAADINPERGTEPAPELPPSAYTGHRFTAPTRNRWFRRRKAQPDGTP